MKDWSSITVVLPPPLHPCLRGSSFGLIPLTPVSRMVSYFCRIFLFVACRFPFLVHGSKVGCRRLRLDLQSTPKVSDGITMLSQYSPPSRIPSSTFPLLWLRGVFFFGLEDWHTTYTMRVCIQMTVRLTSPPSLNRRLDRSITSHCHWTGTLYGVMTRQHIWGNGTASDTQKKLLRVIYGGVF